MVVTHKKFRVECQAWALLASFPILSTLSCFESSIKWSSVPVHMDAEEPRASGERAAVGEVTGFVEAEHPDKAGHVGELKMLIEFFSGLPGWRNWHSTLPSYSRIPCS